MPSSAVEIRRHLDDLRLRGLSTTYINCRRRALHRLEERTRRPALSMTADDLDRYQRTWTGIPASRAVEASHLRGFYQWAARARLLRADPSPVLIIPQRPHRLPRPIGEPNLMIALVHAPDRIRPWLILAAYAGLRACEVSRIDRDDILDLADPPILVVNGKGSKQRIIPMSGTVIGAFREHGLPNRGPVFRRMDGQPGPVSASQVSTLANRYLHSVGVPETLHQLRHRAVTMVYRAEKDLRVAQAFAGHADPRTTSGYSAYAPEALARAVRMLDELQGDGRGR